MQRPRKVPCTVLTGFLSSGKSTLVNHILQSQSCKHIALIENEFGEVGISNAMLQEKYAFQVEEEIIQANCGCMCHTVRGDLIRCLKKIRKRSLAEGTTLDHVLIETTGLADPAALVQTFFAEEFVAQMYSLDGILTLVDAKRLALELQENGGYSVEKDVAKQWAYADMILLTKTDLLEKEALGQIKAHIRTINPSVPIKLALYNQMDMKSILDMNAWSLETVSDTDEGFFDATIHNVITCHFLDDMVKCFDMGGKEVFASHVPPQEAPFGPWLWRAAQERIIRGRLHLVDSSGEDIWVETLDPCVSSVGIDVHGEVHKEKFDQWLNDLMCEKEANLFRYKGILALKGQNSPFIFQGMQTRLTGIEHIHRPWLGGGQKRCKIHVMGNNLGRDELVEGFLKCMALDSSADSPMPPALNFCTSQ